MADLEDHWICNRWVTDTLVRHDIESHNYISL